MGLKYREVKDILKEVRYDPFVTDTTLRYSSLIAHVINFFFVGSVIMTLGTDGLIFDSNLPAAPGVLVAFYFTSILLNLCCCTPTCCSSAMDGVSSSETKGNVTVETSVSGPGRLSGAMFAYWVMIFLRISSTILMIVYCSSHYILRAELAAKPSSGNATDTSGEIPEDFSSQDSLLNGLIAWNCVFLVYTFYQAYTFEYDRDNFTTTLVYDKNGNLKETAEHVKTTTVWKS